MAESAAVRASSFWLRDRIAEGSCPRGRSDAGRASLFTFAGVKSEKNNIIRYIRIQIGHPGACDCVWGVGPRADVATCREPVSRTSETKQDPAAEVYLLGALGVQSVTSHPGTAKGHPAGRMVYKPFEENAIPIRVPLRVPLFAALLGRLVYLGVDIRPLQARGKTRAR